MKGIGDAIGSNARERRRRLQVDVACARQMQPVIVKVGRRETDVPPKLPLKAESSLLDVWLHVISRENKEIRIGGRAGRWRRENRRIAKSGGCNLSGVEIDAGDLNAIL